MLAGLAAGQFALNPNGENIVNPNISFFNSQVSPPLSVNPDNVFMNENNLTTANYQSTAYQIYDASNRPLAASIRRNRDRQASVTQTRMVW